METSQQQHLTELRRKAEEQLQTMMTSLPEKSPEDIQALLHDLHVHQIELTLQNEELRIAQAGLEVSQIQLEASRAKYVNLYDFAPVGYCTLDEAGTLLSVNLTAARQWGFERANVLNTRIYQYIVEQDRDIVFMHLRAAFRSGSRQTCEIRLQKQDGTLFWAQLEGSVVDTEPGGPDVVAVDAAAPSRPIRQCFTTLTDISERKRAEELLNNALEEKNTLMKEILHRTKNNMAMIISLLNFTAMRHEKNPTMLQAFQDIESRIKAMLLVQQKLYQSSSYTQIDLKDYLDVLVPEVFHTLRVKAIGLRLETESVAVSVDKAITCGLLLNELLTNALKYAFPASFAGQPDSPPEIRVVLQRIDAGTVELQVSDNGMGLPPDFTLDGQESLGLTLIAAFARQLRGTFTVSGERGTHWSIRFPEP